MMRTISSSTILNNSSIYDDHCKKYSKVGQLICTTTNLWIIIISYFLRNNFEPNTIVLSLSLTLFRHQNVNFLLEQLRLSIIFVNWITIKLIFFVGQILHTQLRLRQTPKKPAYSQIVYKTSNFTIGLWDPLGKMKKETLL